MAIQGEDFAGLEAKHSLGVYNPRGVTLVRGSGSYVWDAAGRRYLDCTAAYGVASLGHCHPAVAKAIAAQANELIACSGSFGNNQRAKLYEELSAVLPSGMTRIFFCNSGAEANEAALKFARLTTGKHNVVAAMRGFHGRTMGALSATYEPHYREPFSPLLPGFRYVPYNNVAALEEAVTDDVGAIILEAVQGEGGVRPATREFLQSAQTLCQKKNVMLIVDEVQSGFCRTGKFFAVERYDVKPDMLTMAKGIAGGFPMGAIALGDRVASLSVGQHGTTFGGAPLACAAARATLQTLRAERIAERVAEKSAYFFERLQAISSPRIREVRGAGFMIGIELREKAGPHIAAIQERGVLVLNAGSTVIRLLPPLTLEYEEIDVATCAIAAALS
jgi:acetylornithine/LysW-gamma-L-lysine aminotransferase